ncbi:M23 family metallopeptidase, partial [Patescibacteria group bacterium]|nr:M23 family metallopeptidase [Patescibacteria group bacterium]
SYKFHQKCIYNNVYWGIHLGEDIDRPAGTKVMSIGRGKVVYSDIHPGNEKKGNWGNIIVIAHKNPKTKKSFFSLYAHLKKRNVLKGDNVKLGKVIGTIAKSNTPENGWWKEEHLHFSIYIGPWRYKILPGYWRKDQNLTNLYYWQEATKFINNYNIRNYGKRLIN